MHGKLNKKERTFISRCPHCEGTPQLVLFGEILYPYKKNYGAIWRCQSCAAYVGCHKGTTRPKGFLANQELKRLRILAHSLFDPIWKSGEMRRSQAYARMAEVLKIQNNQAHISQLNAEELRKLIRSLILRRSKRDDSLCEL